MHKVIVEYTEYAIIHNWDEKAKNDDVDNTNGMIWYTSLLF